MLVLPSTRLWETGKKHQNNALSSVRRRSDGVVCVNRLFSSNKCGLVGRSVKILGLGLFDLCLQYPTLPCDAHASDDVSQRPSPFFRVVACVCVYVPNERRQEMQYLRKGREARHTVYLEKECIR